MSHNHNHCPPRPDHSTPDHGEGNDQPDETEPALQSLIYKQIEFDKIRCLNETETDAGRKVVEKTWQQRLEPAPELISDADEQLILFVPYRLHSTDYQ